jgi:diguanylate cyclase (GGDEF)-like protein
LVFIIYLYVASRSVSGDYWRALRTSMLLEMKAAEFRSLSITDTLTQLHNRFYFEDKFQTEWYRACRHRQPIAICLIDLDYFKRINDTYGHGIGDYCLRHTANVLKRKVCRAGDVVARYGGEEFIVLLANTGLEGAVVFANKIRQAISSVELVQGENSTTVYASIGVAATTVIDIADSQKLINQADKPLYQAKNHGRNRVEFFED